MAAVQTAHTFTLHRWSPNPLSRRSMVAVVVGVQEAEATAGLVALEVVEGTAAVEEPGEPGEPVVGGAEPAERAAKAERAVPVLDTAEAVEWPWAAIPMALPTSPLVS